MSTRNLEINQNHRTFYIDGSCNNSKKGNLSRVGGVGIIEVLQGRVECHSFGPYPDVTSARMEVLGLLLVLRMIKTPNSLTTIYCDNQYVVNTKQNGWCFNWVNNGEARPNIDLWEIICQELSKLVKIGAFVELKWVRGHAGNIYNEYADTYANKGRLGQVSKNLYKL